MNIKIKEITDGHVSVDVGYKHRVVLHRDGEKHYLPTRHNPINTNLKPGDYLEEET